MESATTPKALPRLRIALNLVLQTFLVLFIFVAVNYLSCRHNTRLDFTADSKFSLSSTTIQFLESLDQEVEIIVVFMAGSPSYDDITGLVQEYERKAEGRLRIEHVDPARHLARAADLRTKFGITLEENTVIVISGDRVKGVTESSMVLRDKDEPRRIEEFRGESAITAALIAAVEKEPRKLYLASGHRKLEELQRLMDEIRGILSIQNASTHELLFSSAERIPEDCDALLLVGPRVDLTQREIEMLRTYWETDKGSLFVILDPNSDTPNLTGLLRSYGITPRNDRVLLAAGVSGLGVQKTYTVPAVFLEGSPVTRELIGVNTQFTGQSQSLDVVTYGPLVEKLNLTVTPLVLADQRFWGETRYREDAVSFDETEDHLQPLYLAASVEKNAVNDPRLRIDSSRLIVTGNANLLDSSPHRIKQNYDFFLSAINWMLDRDELIGISPKVPTDYSLTLTEKQFSRIQLLVLLVMPSGAFLLGFMAWSLRRN